MAILVLSYTFICLLMYQFYAANLHINLIFMHFGGGEILSNCQVWVLVVVCFLPRLVTKKYPAVNLPDIERITSFKKKSFF